MTDWLHYMAQGDPGFLGVPNDIYLAIIRILIIFVAVVMVGVPFAMWWERRLLGFFQDRFGPNRVATITIPENFPIHALRARKFRMFGLLQPVADGIKMFLKEDVMPKNADRLVFWLAPALAIFPAVAIAGTMPWAPAVPPFIYLTPIADVEIGLLYVLAVASLGAYGLVLAGYASNNKYSLLGGLRGSAQLISYELAMGMSLAAIVLGVGSIKLTELVKAQEGPLFGMIPYLQNWFLFTPFGFVSAVIFMVCLVAETNRPPFDLPEAENELIAGYHTEYSSMKFASFMLGEYATMLVYGGLFSVVFLGGYNFMPFNWTELAASIPAAAGFFQFMASANFWLAPLGFLLKSVAVFTFFIWLRATLPRLRYDQLMDLGWKTLLPASVANFIVVGLWVIGTSLSERAGYGPVGGWVAVVVAFVILIVLYLNFVAKPKKDLHGLEHRKVRMVNPRIGGSP